MNTYCVQYVPEDACACTCLAHFFAMSAQDAVDLFRMNQAGRIVAVFRLEMRRDWK